MVVVGEASFRARFNAPDSQIADLLEGGTDLFRKLPPDIMRDILSRLPLENTMRCKCVCRSWHDLIERGVYPMNDELYVKIQAWRFIINKMETEIFERRKYDSLVARGSTIVVIAIAVGCFIFGTRKHCV